MSIEKQETKRGQISIFMKVIGDEKTVTWYGDENRRIIDAIKEKMGIPEEVLKDCQILKNGSKNLNPKKTFKESGIGSITEITIIPKAFGGS